MAIEAPISKFKKNTFMIWIAVCIGAAVYCAYDGYFNEDFRSKHTNEDGKPDSTLVFNQKSPPYFVGAAVVLGAYLFVVGGRKIVADENELVISNKEKIPYDSIQKIDKTDFETKGFFVITYKNEGGIEVNRKLGDRTYDNLAPVLEHLVAKIS